MTNKANSQIAGVTFLLYIAIGIISMDLFSHASGGDEGTTAELANYAQHQSFVGVNLVLTMLGATCALVLAVTLHALTRDQDRDLAMMALCCRLSEGIIIFAISPLLILGLQSIAISSTMVTGADAVSVNAIGALLLKMDRWFPIIPATFFALGSTIFSYLFLRARSIPRPLAWLGVLASILLVVAIPVQLAGFIVSPVTTYIWVPVLAFEVTFSLWLLTKGVKNNITTNEFKY